MRYFALVATFFLFSCQPSAPDNSASTSSASSHTIEQQKKVSAALDINSLVDFEQAQKGLIASAEDLKIYHQNGTLIWDNSAYQFIQDDAPATANPSLWRQEKLNNISGLFKVVEGIYQIRGFDLANMTIIEGESGWIIVDPLTSAETANAALTFAQKHLGVHPITAILMTHAHIDHFGGVLGIASSQEITQQGIRVIAPNGFMEAATSENIIAGVAMARRSAYMYGKNLEKSPTGALGSGLGKSPAFGTFTIATPTELIGADDTALNIDGIDFVFQDASGTESIAEFTFYLPQFKAFAGAELVSRNMHNLYTLRGAQVRDGLRWSVEIDQALQMFGDAEVYFGSHHWPVWGNQEVRTFLANQRDLYKFIHDQSVRLMNMGLTANEIAEQIVLPSTLNEYFANRGYYGTLRHNAKAVYQFYMGWFDANPANLNPLPPAESAVKYVQMMGGAENILLAAQQDFDNGEYRWVAQLLNHLVFAQPENTQAKTLLAKTYEQLAYQAESGPWRNFYLTGAQELMQGRSERGIELALMKGILVNTPVKKFFESMSVRLNSDSADGEHYRVALVFTDLDERYLLEVKNSVLHHRVFDGSEVDATLFLTHELFVHILINQAGVRETLLSDDLSIDGSLLDLIGFFSLFDKPQGKFNIVTP
jgi:alkyl sulfatase BDS1-like metallo-beta-lactamase superfamily hydrolase